MVQHSSRSGRRRAWKAWDCCVALPPVAAPQALTALIACTGRCWTILLPSLQVSGRLSGAAHATTRRLEQPAAASAGDLGGEDESVGEEEEEDKEGLEGDSLARQVLMPGTKLQAAQHVHQAAERVTAVSRCAMQGRAHGGWPPPLVPPCLLRLPPSPAVHSAHTFSNPPSAHSSPCADANCGRRAGRSSTAGSLPRTRCTAGAWRCQARPPAAPACQRPARRVCSHMVHAAAGRQRAASTHQGTAAMGW